MRTTIDIPEVMYRSVKERCASEGTTLRHITIALYGDWMQRPDWRPRVETKSVLTEEKPESPRKLACFGIIKPRKHADGPHDMESVRVGIVEGLKKEYAGLKKRRGFV